MSVPEPANIGFYASRSGLVQESPCAPGTYTARMASVQCMPCSAGHECVLEGLGAPAMCTRASYRAWSLQISCLKCPQGTWSPAPNPLTDASLCEPCPAGVACGVDGLSSLEGALICPEGYVCYPGTNSTSVFKASFFFFLGPQGEGKGRV